MKLRMKTFKEVAIDHIEVAFNAWAKDLSLDPRTTQMQTEYSPALQKFITVILYVDTEEDEVQNDETKGECT